MPNAIEGLLGGMQASPRNKLMGLLADGLKAADRYANKLDPTMPGGKANQPLSLLSDFASLKSLAEVANNVSYGYPLTNRGVANVPFLKPETGDALMMAPISPRNALAAAAIAGGGDTAALKAMTLWHGSPHKFDKFDASKIGTGEGAQAYGHGLYLAESPGVAGSYKKALSGKANIEMLDETGSVVNKAALTAEQKAVKRVYESALASPESTGGMTPQEFAIAWMNDPSYSNAERAAAHAMKNWRVEDTASLYKVDLPDDQIAKMLDWDKPLSQQAPGVRESVGKSFPGTYVNGRFVDPNNSQLTGRALLDQLGEIANKRNAPGMRMAEPALRAAGIPGIRYLDGGSRTAGQGSSNFVVFQGNENLLSILERNGQPLK